MSVCWWTVVNDITVTSCRARWVPNHRRLDCLLNHLFRRRSKKTSKLRATALCEGKPPVTCGFPSYKASYTENIYIWWSHHEMGIFVRSPHFPIPNFFSHPSVTIGCHLELWIRGFFNSVSHPVSLGPRLVAIFQMTYSKTFSSLFWMIFHWNLLYRIKFTVFQHWFR